jgi:hypothetical protein
VYIKWRRCWKDHKNTGTTNTDVDKIWPAGLTL